MNVVDIIIISLAGIAAYLGFRQGTIRLLGMVIGVFCGIILSSLLYEKLAFLTQNSTIKTVVLVAILLGICFLASDLLIVASKWLQSRFSKLTGTLTDRIGSGIVATAGTIFVIWLAVTMFSAIMPQTVRAETADSLLLTYLTRHVNLPSSIGNIPQLLRPFTAPDVFVDQEPNFDSSGTIATKFNDLDKSTTNAKKSLTKITTWGCGSIGHGSGFVISKRHIATNAHVVAGSERLSVEIDGVGLVGKVVWFDPKLDFALLATETELAVSPLAMSQSPLGNGTIVATMGYTSDKQLMIGDAIILQRLQADGYDIYGKEKTTRSVYALRGDVVAGNSGGPIINADGQVAGIIFGHSTNQNKTGYAITSDQVLNTIKAAQNLVTTTSTGPCAAS